MSKVNPNEAEAAIEQVVKATLDRNYTASDLQQAYKAFRISQLYLIKALLVATDYDEELIAQVKSIWRGNVDRFRSDIPDDALYHQFSLSLGELSNIWPSIGL
ncbi:hypothetical protein [Leptolyngbya sp. FACHB-261]|uniref:hypothetical protein n=1 Tax=Leptolyngbya sp. FACHB-261 TaxID=2692806 RepID=UPI001689F52C|nr:hypothetical protein [Leptolyngbya sp. FACHB-261]MBD2103894.1 hypothetical protein [Leptolyngbya sp. FACHB-261]